MQFDIYANPVTRARRAFPFVVILQSDIADSGHDRVVAFLAPQKKLPTTAGRLLPIVTIGEQSLVILLPSLTTLPTADLSKPIANVAAYRESIVLGIDWLFLGV